MAGYQRDGGENGGEKCGKKYSERPLAVDAVARVHPVIAGIPADIEGDGSREAAP